MEGTDNQHVKRKQSDYSHAFKLQVIGEVERGELSQAQACRKYGIQSHTTIRTWIEKFGKFDRSYELNRKKMKSPEQQILELQQQIKLLERKNRTLEKEVDQTNKKAIFFDMMIDIAEEELQISIRKKSLSNQLTNIKKSKKRR